MNNYLRVALIWLLLTILYSTTHYSYATDVPFDTIDISLLGINTVALITDWRQTQEIVKQPYRYHEKNIILGPHPSMAEVNTYYVTSIGLTYLLANILPDPYRKIYLGGQAVVEISVVRGNVMVGHSMRW